MNLSDEKVIEFQNLYKEHFGEEISKKDACEQGIKLLQLISVLYRPKDISARQIELLKHQK